MKTLILNAKTIDPKLSAEEFLSQYYQTDLKPMAELKHDLFASEDVVVTEVFNWPVDIPAWKEIASALESIQQHSASFYVIWGPETENLLEQQTQKLKTGTASDARQAAA